jgi:hypothetical protein
MRRLVAIPTGLVLAGVLTMNGCGLDPPKPAAMAIQSSDPAESARSKTETLQPVATERHDVVEPSESPAVGKVAATEGDLTDISFEDLQLNMQPDIVFRPFMLTDRAKELNGQRIRISGFMLPDAQSKGIKQFVLLKNTECKFGPQGQADHLINVIMNEGETAIYRREAVHVEGLLTINPFTGPDGNTWSVYDLACERVSKYRPRR